MIHMDQIRQGPSRSRPVSIPEISCENIQLMAVKKRLITVGRPGVTSNGLFRRLELVSITIALLRYSAHISQVPPPPSGILVIILDWSENDHSLLIYIGRGKPG